MKYVRIALFAVFFPALFLFVDYVLPAKEVVLITDTYSRITDIGRNWMFYAQDDTVSSAAGSQDTKRDIRFMNALTRDGKVRVYRNEDTGWVWPPYFKYDSSNLQAQFSSMESTPEAPKWVMLTSYGWRIPFLSIYPNTVGAHALEDPDESTISLAALLVLLAAFALLLFLERAYTRFVRRSISPALAGIDARADALREDIAEAADRKTLGMRRWLRTWKGEPRL